MSTGTIEMEGKHIGSRMRRLRNSFGRLLRKSASWIEPRSRIETGHVYNQDGLTSIHNHEFIRDRRFAKAYARGIQAAGSDYGWQWRVHIGLWAASHARQLEGDFVECGVNRGFLSSAIMDYVDWNSENRTFFLLDTFAGINVGWLTDAELKAGRTDANRRHLDDGFYVQDVELVRRNFSEWHNVKIVQGTIPDTLNQIDADMVAYVHLDLNCTVPEVAAISNLWDRIVPGGIILLDDYAYRGFEESKRGMDSLADRLGIAIASLPTGQGLMIKTV